MKTQEEMIHAYLKALRNLPGSKKKNEEFRSYIQDSIQDVFAAHPDAGEQNVRELLGDPETVRHSYIQNLSPAELELGSAERGKKQRKQLMFLIPAFLLVAVIASLFIYARFFSPTDIAIAYPVDQNAEKYVERPMLIGTGSIFGKSSNRILHERMFIDNVSLKEDEMVQKYPNGYHITCTVLSEKKGTIVLWSGYGTTEEGVTENIAEEYVCPYSFRVREPDALSEQAAKRARYAEEEVRRVIEATD